MAFRIEATSALARIDAPPAPPGAAAASLPRDLRLLLGGLLALAAWDGLGLDLPISRLFGGAEGFALRDAWLFSSVLHDGARWVAWAIAIGLVIGIWRPLPFASGVPRRDRVAWVVATIACVALIPLLKLASLTSCPWSLAEFGGTAWHVSHWLLGQADGGPGRCFPAGHATAAFCFLPGWFVLRRSAPKAAALWLAATLAAGAVLTLVQVVRGAHFVSHSLWTAWFCWALTLVLLHALRMGSIARRQQT